MRTLNLKGQILRFSFVLWLSATCVAQDQEPLEQDCNWKVATFGGVQFWTDVRVVGDWRIQRNSYFGHYRLLDGENVRHAWGEKSDCDEQLILQIKAGNAKPLDGKVVILLHGLFRSWQSMRPLADHLRSQGFKVINFRYASSRQSVAEHSRKLNLVIADLPKEVTEINFVAHSLGNIVVRRYVADASRIDPRIRRMVMLGPPNQGSRMARLLKESLTFRLLAGTSGAQLGGGWHKLKANLATPPFEFGIIAGGYGNVEEPYSNPILRGQDDFTVSTEETMLSGATDFLVKPLVHTTMMKDDAVKDVTVKFLKSGYFISKDKMKPIHTVESEAESK